MSQRPSTMGPAHAPAQAGSPSEGGLGDDLLFMASAIARHIYGDASPANIRRIHHLAATKVLPTFQLGRTICARRSTLNRWIEEQEAQARRPG